MLRYAIRLIELANGVASPENGKYLVEYDPTKNGYRGEILTSAEIALARRFNDTTQALDCWRQSHGKRPDGRPNRPLTAWTIELVPIKVTSESGAHE